MDLVIREKDCGRAFAQFAHVFGIFVIAPAISKHTPHPRLNRSGFRLETLGDFRGRQQIDWIERGHLYPELVGFRPKKTDSARHIQNSFSYKVTRLKQEVAAILFE